MTKANDVTAYYAEQFKNWPTKFVGDKPTAEQLTTINRLGARHGLQCLANAMALRDSGVTGAQIVMACGAPQLNKMRDFITDGLLKRVPAPKLDGKTVYKLEVTAKGTKRIDSAIKREAEAEAKANGDEPAKPKRKAAGKAKSKGKAKPAEATSEPAVPAVPAEPAMPAEAGATA